jgi:hypothetical protein
LIARTASTAIKTTKTAVLAICEDSYFLLVLAIEKVEAALAFAMAGDTTRAEYLAQSLNKLFPLDTQLQSLWLPAIEAQLALDKKNPASALTTLRDASAI